MDRIKSLFMPFLAVLTTLMFGAMVFLLAFYKIPVENKEIFISGLSIMGTLTVGVNTYYFGSSKSSADKNQLLADSAPAVSISTSTTTSTPQ